MENELRTKDDIIRILSCTDPAQCESIRRSAEDLLLSTIGPTVSLRGLVEFSNICVNDCRYCGIAAGNRSVLRYCLTLGQILDAARWCAQAGYGSIVLQSGERRDPAFIVFVEEAVNAIKNNTVSPVLPRGLGITLCVGEQNEEAYRRFFKAGAHRYLLRIETTNPTLFARLHPEHQTLETRLHALQTLRRIGYQVGTGVMIGLPGQTVEDLADDILFFKQADVAMIGMGPYIDHADTPMHTWPDSGDRTPRQRFDLSLRMIAAARLYLKDVNIASTTALQALDETGREQGLQWGANVIMPQITPTEFRKQYLLYEGKPCVEESAQLCKGCLEARITGVGRTIGYNAWGDSLHVSKAENHHAVFS